MSAIPISSVSEPDAQPAGLWFVAYVGGSMEAERRLAAYLHDRGIRASVPVYEDKSWRSDGEGRKIQVRRVRPVFKHYVPFIAESAAEAADIRYRDFREHRLISSYLEVRDQARFTRELADVERAADARVIVVSYDMFVEVGHRVRIKAGPLEGTIGYIDKIHRGRVILRNHNRQTDVGIQLPGDTLETAIENLEDAEAN